MFYSTDTNEHGLKYNPFKAIVAPRPIAWISSLNADNSANLAPYSFFNGMSDHPPMIGYATAPQKLGLKEPKDSVTNIERTKEFCISIVSHELRDAMNISSGHFPHGTDEFEKAGLEKGSSNIISCPFVAAAPVAMECTLYGVIDLPNGNKWVMGNVVAIHIQDKYITDGKLDVTKYQPVARLGYKDYATITDTYELSRPK